MSTLQTSLAEVIGILRYLHYQLAYDLCGTDRLQVSLTEAKAIICRMEQDLQQKNRYVDEH